jgi:hypothetical protein
MNMFPPKKNDKGVPFSSVNDFRLSEQCVQKAKLHFYK